MKITSISLSIFEIPTNTPYFNLQQEEVKADRRWRRQHHSSPPEEIQVLHVQTDESIEGVCTVGDARYPTMRQIDLDQLRILTIGEDPFDRERLNSKLHAATRGMFAKSGWFGTFDNCLWDIAGKVANLPVYALIGRARERCPAYYNFNSRDTATAVAGAQEAVALGFPAVKDHFQDDWRQNIAHCQAVRDAVGPDIDILHDAAGCDYTLEEAIRVGRALEELDFGWFEEPLSDRNIMGLQKLCQAVNIPIMALETLMNDLELSAQYLMLGATDYVRVHARHGTTSMLKLSHMAELHNTRVEMNGPGGLFGLVHTHLSCAISNTSYYEYFPGGTRDTLGKEIGLINPPLPAKGYIAPPTSPGWGAEWDWDYFEKKRLAHL
ncbi:MAG: enolase C-terminal domain-like protein [Chloroflexota bacterium]